MVCVNVWVVGVTMTQFDYMASFHKGHKYNEYVAKVLQTFGVPNVSVPEMWDASNAQERLDKTLNEKDVLVDGLILEVKSRNLSFRSSYDFPYDQVMVDTVSGFDAKVVKPWAYVIVSQITEGMFVIPTATKQYWTIRSYHDVDRDIQDRFYMTSKRHCRPFVEMVDLLLERAHERTNQM